MFHFSFLCRQTIVSASDVVITGIRDTSSGLQVQFYVRGMRGGVIPASAAVSAIQVMGYHCNGCTWKLTCVQLCLV